MSDVTSATEPVAVVVATAVVEAAAPGRPVEGHGVPDAEFPVQRLHSEVLPRGVGPEDRMRELLDEYAPLGP